MKPLRRSPLVQWPGLRGGEAAPGAGEVSMSEGLALTLRFGAAACGLDEPEFVRRAIAEKAERIGLGALAASLPCASGAGAVRKDSQGLGVPGRRVASPFFTSDGDLIDLPDFDRQNFPRFASGP